MKGTHAHDIAAVLDRAGVAVRTGAHCAMPLLKCFSLLATCRVSLGLLQYTRRDRCARACPYQAVPTARVTWRAYTRRRSSR
ncbi:aminotransferase class V-fold PLP-dependent enzyme [Bradyrhizobium sp. CCBAU 11357]|uniref:aminotransferase class V-fold PLP-dependent enzyme n=1 Tax=Bradyrhizobium sp. CCBAU 11357 TaxID=1630808 RepID=UPI002304991A|nr:aminotransferase class V-fold PLP-dependent enzyme [Bradyrhizobium sp. CCBAU 11357]